MSNLRRYYSEGQIYFVTCITYQRNKILFSNCDVFWESVNGIKNKLDFKVIVWVVNPDHFHMIIDPKNNNLSEIIKRIKLSFSKKYKYRYSIGAGRTWQNRFWDHIIRNETDFNRHVDYIHFNPVKHNLVKSPFQYKFSSIHKFRDFYDDDWGMKTALSFDGEYGE